MHAAAVKFVLSHSARGRRTFDVSRGNAALSTDDTSWVRMQVYARTHGPQQRCVTTLRQSDFLPGGCLHRWVAIVVIFAHKSDVEIRRLENRRQVGIL